jgi:hypothetical protein
MLSEWIGARARRGWDEGEIRNEVKGNG